MNGGGVGRGNWEHGGVYLDVVVVGGQGNDGLVHAANPRAFHDFIIGVLQQLLKLAGVRLLGHVRRHLVQELIHVKVVHD